ncbi:MAG: transcriptional repressor [Phycisphaerae bacterium]|nr:transcriptional repressor [Phycisphaerae bacterium]
MTSPDKKNTAKLLKKANLRQTHPRRAVLRVLIDADAPITHQQITDKLSDSPPDKVTIYRVLDCLMENGIVHRAFMKDRTAFFELAHNCSKTQCHPHFTCTNCKKTICIKNAKIPLAEINEKGFKINHQKVELEGLCPECNV